MPGREITDAIILFAARQVIEKHHEMQKELHMVFIDLDKSCERVPRQPFWRCLGSRVCPKRKSPLVKDTHEDTRTQVKNSVGVSGKLRFDMLLDVWNGASKSSHLVYAVCRRYGDVHY